MKLESAGLFCDGYLPILDGVTTTVRNYALWLGRKSVRSLVVTPYVPNAREHDPFPVIRFMSLPTIVRPPYRIGLPDIDIGLQIILKQHSFSIVHSHTPFGAGIVALRAARERGIPIVSTFHSKYRDDLTQALPIKRLVDDQIKRIVDYYYSVDHVWIPQRSVEATLREYGYRGPCEVMENGIDLVPPDDIHPYREQGSKYLDVKPDTPVGLYVGQHILEKNLEFLVRSIPGVLSAFPDFMMVFVGEGYAKHTLRTLARDLGIANSILFHDAVYDREVLKAVYARADLLLFPSIYDNAPLVMREAAALRTPAVLIQGTSAADVVRDGVNGYLAPQDVDAYASRVVDALSHQESLGTVALEAQRTLCKSWETVVDEVIERYSAILSRWA